MILGVWRLQNRSQTGSEQAGKDDHDDDGHHVFDVVESDFREQGIGRGRQLFFGFVLEHETYENGAAQRGEHEQDVVADKIKGIENAFASEIGRASCRERV